MPTKNESESRGAVNALSGIFRVLHFVMAALFACAAVALIIVSTSMGWHVFAGGLDQAGAQSIIEAVGFLAAAVVALQIAETIIEEEVVRRADISAPTRVRRFLSRFLVVLIVALAVEGLVAIFKAVHEDLTQLGYASSVLVGTGVLLAAWGLFIHLNRSAEELEPEAMEEAKIEDKKLR